MLDILAVDGIKHKGKAGILCRCVCGTEFITRKYYVQSGRVVSCGCQRYVRGRTMGKRNKSHGVTKHYLYPTWCNIMRRCYCVSSDNYEHYGARGIRVYWKWHRADSFIEDIIALIGHRPDGYEIDRLRNDKDYSPENVRWATRTQQNQNKRSTLLVSIGGTVRCLKAWSIHSGIPYTTLHSRYQKGIREEKLLVPVRKRK